MLSFLRTYIPFAAVVLGKVSNVGIYLIFHNIQYKVRGEFSIFAGLVVVMDYALKRPLFLI